MAQNVKKKKSGIQKTQAISKNSTKSSITFDSKYISQIMVIVSGLLLLLTLSVPSSPFLSVLHYPIDLVMGKLGFFISLMTILGAGILLFLNPEYIKKNYLKKLIGIIAFILLVSSFPLLDTLSMNSLDFGRAQDFGGYPFGWILSTISQVLFNFNPFITKTFVMICFLGYLFWVLWTLNITFSLPKISLVEPEESEISKGKFVQDFESYKNSLKTNQKSFSIKGVSQKVKKALPSTKIDIEETISSVLKDKNLKTKQEVKDKLREKFLSDETKLVFSGDKPCFDANIIKNGDYGDLTDESYIHEKALAVQQKLAEFGINVSIEGYSVGPSVIQLNIKPEAGVKMTAIENLKKDLTGALKTKSLRIIAPIPGTEYVGIELLNPHPQFVKLKDILIGKEFTDNVQKSQTNLIIGKSISGEDISKPLEAMPHLLVAGATGSGKSVGVNNFILSLMYQNDPSELKFIMVDPKQVELSMYDGLPYLLAPVITQAPKALKVLKWACEHMDYRYGLLRNQKAKEIKEYNAKVGESEKLYRIVIIIDELADLMMSSPASKKETENYISRLAQKARAVGIHLIIATQRPSVDVLTGVIKANIPARISFAVVGRVDSKTILDSKGAEDLIGKGDLLYLDPAWKTPMRIQAPYVETSEIEKIADQLKNKFGNGLPEEEFYLPELQNILSGKNDNDSNYYGGENGRGGDDEELVQRAIEVISQAGKASATLLQRKLGLGFAKASKILDILEERGMIGPGEGAKPREVYI